MPNSPANWVTSGLAAKPAAALPIAAATAIVARGEMIAVPAAVARGVIAEPRSLVLVR